MELQALLLFRVRAFEHAAFDVANLRVREVPDFGIRDVQFGIPLGDCQLEQRPHSDVRNRVAAFFECSIAIWIEFERADDGLDASSMSQHFAAVFAGDKDGFAALVRFFVPQVGTEGSFANFQRELMIDAIFADHFLLEEGSGVVFHAVQSPATFYRQSQTWSQWV